MDWLILITFAFQSYKKSSLIKTMHQEKSKQENRISTKITHTKMGLMSNLEQKKRKSNLEGNLQKSFSSDRLETIVQWIGSYFIRNVFQFLKKNAQQIIIKK